MLLLHALIPCTCLVACSLYRSALDPSALIVSDPRALNHSAHDSVIQFYLLCCSLSCGGIVWKNCLMMMMMMMNSTLINNVLLLLYFRTTHNRSARGSAVLNVRDSATVCPYVYTLHAFCMIHLWFTCNAILLNDIWDYISIHLCFLFMSINFQFQCIYFQLANGLLHKHSCHVCLSIIAT